MEAPRASPLSLCTAASLRLAQDSWLCGGVSEQFKGEAACPPCLRSGPVVPRFEGLPSCPVILCSKLVSKKPVISSYYSLNAVWESCKRVLRAACACIALDKT